jgi:hypothetical protein
VSNAFSIKNEKIDLEYETLGSMQNPMNFFLCQFNDKLINEFL